MCWSNFCLASSALLNGLFCCVGVESLTSDDDLAEVVDDSLEDVTGEPGGLNFGCNIL